MNVFGLALKSLRYRLLSSVLTASAVAVGAALVLTTLQVRQQSEAYFSTSAYGYDLIVGAKGSPLQLVLNTIYHLDRPIENIPISLMERIRANSLVEYAVPFSLGDNFRGYRIVGTDGGIFEKLRPGPEGRALEFASGGPLQGKFDCVLGSRVAEKTGLAPGDKIFAVHGLEEKVVKAEEAHAGEEEEEVIGGEEPAEDAHDTHAFAVRGVLKPTGTPLDRVLLVDYRAILALHGLEGEGARQEITSLAVKMKSPTLAFAFRQAINKGNEAQAVFPFLEIDKLFKTVGQASRLLLVLGYLVTALACLSIFLAVYNSFGERKRSLAVLRAMGAGHLYLFLALFLESSLICAAGCLAGFVLSHALLWGLGPWFSMVAGMELSPWVFYPGEWTALGMLLGLGMAASALPGLMAYRAEAGQSLAETA